jgi:hypothetical protein
MFYLYILPFSRLRNPDVAQLSCINVLASWAGPGQDEGGGNCYEADGLIRGNWSDTRLAMASARTSN